MHEKKTILIVGAFSSNPSIYMYATSFVAALRNLGYRVVSYNYRKKYVPIQSINTFLINQKLIFISTQINPVLIFIIKGESIKASTLIKIKANNKNIRIINFYPDNPFAFWNGNSNENVLKSFPFFNCVLIWTSSLIPIIKAAGALHSCYFPFAFDEKLFHQKIIISSNEYEKYASDVCFVGTWEFEREQWLVELRKRLPKLNIAIWGNLWRQQCTSEILLQSLRGDALYGLAMIKAFRSSTIVLNFIRQQNLDGHNMRTFEVPASKSLLLTEWTREQAEVLFQENTNILCFKNIEELVEKIIYYIVHTQERVSLIEKSYNHVQRYILTEQLERYFSRCPMINKEKF